MGLHSRPRADRLDPCHACRNALLLDRSLAQSTAGDLTRSDPLAIRFSLASLGDHHSSFHPTPALEALEATRKPRQPAAQPASQPQPSSPFTGRYEPEGRLARFGGKTFALVVVTKCFTENDRQFIAYATKLQGIIADLDKAHPAGWVVDLRGNVGGNMWPMLAGIGPVLGEGCLPRPPRYAILRRAHRRRFHRQYRRRPFRWRVPVAHQDPVLQGALRWLSRATLPWKTVTNR